MPKIANKRMESGRGDIFRVSRLTVLNRWIPLGNLAGGPGWRCCATLAVLHYLGRPLFIVLVRYENQLTALYRRLKSVRGGD